MDFLESALERLEGLTCLPNQMTVAFPSSCVESCPEAVRMIRDAMTRTFGGCTSTEGRGAWVDDRGNVIDEPVTVLVSAHNCARDQDRKAIIKTVTEAAKLASQQAVFLKSDRAWIVPTDSLLAHYST